jgi:hypothetical protein
MDTSPLMLVLIRCNDLAMQPLFLHPSQVVIGISNQQTYVHIYFFCNSQNEDSICVAILTMIYITVFVCSWLQVQIGAP